MTEWVRTSRGWVLRQLECTECSATSIKINSRSPSTCYDREANFGRNIKVSGSKGQRRLSVCVSEFIEHIGLMEAVVDFRRHTYLHDLMMMLMKQCLNKVSGCAHRQLFKILEAIVTQAIASEMNIGDVKELLVCTMKSLIDGNAFRIGSQSLWNRHIQNVSNLSAKMEQFTVSERTEDGLPGLTDLPKECVREIMLKLSDHRDVIHLGETCTDLYYMTQDSSLWQGLVQYHFSEKQMNTFIEDDMDSTVSVWQRLQQSCSKKYGLRQTYTDRLVICSGCKTLHWLMQGHTCWTANNEDTDGYLEPVNPDELYNILFVNN